MRKIIMIIAVAIITASCAVTRDRQVSKYFLDYRPYSDAGFFISPNPYTGEFTSIGELSITVTPAILSKSQAPVQVKNYNDALYAPVGTGAIVENIPASELIDMAVKEAQSVGANGISNFKCVAVYNTQVSRSGVVNKELSHYEISGLCILIRK